MTEKGRNDEGTNDERISVRKRFRRKKNYVNRDCVGYITNVRTYSAGGEKMIYG